MNSIIFVFLLTGVCHVTGWGGFRQSIPNGNRVSHPCKPNYFWQGVGHNAAEGGGPRNPFGLDFLENNKTWTKSLCMKDSDGDGKTNGEELGDPDCTWKKGGSLPSRTEDITHPGICTPFYAPHCQGKNNWVDCTHEKFSCPAINNTDTKNFTMRFPKTKVPAKETTYKCMIFDVPADEIHHMIAFTANIDNDNVMHHIILRACRDTGAEIPPGPYDCDMGAGYGCGEMLGGWTLGTSGYCLHENFGMLFGKNGAKRMALEFHWNNPQMEKDWFDASGMTIYYTNQLRPNNGAVLSLGQNYLAIPPGESETVFDNTCTSECTSLAMKKSIYVTSAVNHMHYLGKSQSVEHRRNGSSLSFITNEVEYNYDSPELIVFDTPVEVKPGDELITTCKYNSIYSKKWVYYGDGTSDEMCFAFLWFYPAEAMPENYCTNYRSLTFCALSQRRIVLDGCDVFKFVSLQDETALGLMTAVDEQCHLSGQCHEGCEMAVRNMTMHPCLKDGDAAFYVKKRFEGSMDGLKFLRKLDMCSNKKCSTEAPPVIPTASGSTGLVVSVFMLAVMYLFVMV